jgi:signal transduction histidine kinase
LVGNHADRFEGFIAAVLNLNSLITGLWDINLSRRYNMEIVESGKSIYTQPGSVFANKKWAEETELKLYGVAWAPTSWQVRLWPTPLWLDELQTTSDHTVLVSGLIMTALLAFLTYFFQLARARTRQIEIANAGLEEQIIERQQAQAALADFTAMIIHDLRSPLSNVISIVSTIKEGVFGPVNADQATWLDKAEKTTQSSVGLIGDFLDVSKLEAGHIDLRKTEVDLRQLIQAGLDLSALTAQQKKILLKNEIDPSLPSVHADPRRLEQVMNNLLSNALKFTPEGGEIRAGARCNHKDISVWVEDTGGGIASDELGQIFQKYKQTASGATSQFKGTGLGLVVCKMIVEAHGGILRVESEEGKGAKFTFTLPRLLIG